MAEKLVLNIPVKQWTQTAEDWEAQNPVLAKGQMGIEATESGANPFKIGDGEKAWNDLAYSSVTMDAIEKMLDEKGLATLDGALDGAWLTKTDKGIAFNEEQLAAFLNNCVIDGGPVTADEPDDAPDDGELEDPEGN